MAEEETRTLLRKKLDNDEEMRKIKTIAMKVSYTSNCLCESL